MMSKKSVLLWSVVFILLISLLCYVFWPRYLSLPLVDNDDPVLDIFKRMPCRDLFPSSSRAVVRFYDSEGIPLKDRVYTITPISVHKGAVDDPDIKFRTGWYWVSSAKIDWCGTAGKIVDAKDFYYSAEINLDTIRFAKAKECLKNFCDA